ncbi:hypothetical protein V5O48_015902, partial [Marasmius crinis-equi]
GTMLPAMTDETSPLVEGVELGLGEIVEGIDDGDGVLLAASNDVDITKATNTFVGPDSKYSPPWPFSNMSKWLLMNWFYTCEDIKSESELDRLVHEVVLHPEFKVSDLRDFDAHSESRMADEAREARARELLSDSDKTNISDGQASSSSCTNANVSGSSSRRYWQPL